MEKVCDLWINGNATFPRCCRPFDEDLCTDLIIHDPMFSACFTNQGMDHCWVKSQVATAQKDLGEHIDRVQAAFTDDLNRKHEDLTSQLRDKADKTDLQLLATQKAVDNQFAQTATKQDLTTLNASVAASFVEAKNIRNDIRSTQLDVEKVASLVTESATNLVKRIDSRASQTSVSEVVRYNQIMMDHLLELQRKTETTETEMAVMSAQITKLTADRETERYYYLMSGAIGVMAVVFYLNLPRSTKSEPQQHATTEQPNVDTKRVRRVRAAEPRDEVPTRSTRSKRALAPAKVSPA
jgi:hypothetical protein